MRRIYATTIYARVLEQLKLAIHLLRWAHNLNNRTSLAVVIKWILLCYMSLALDFYKKFL